LVFTFLVVSGEIFEAFAYFTRFPGAFALLFVRSVVFYAGAWLYTLLMKHFGAVAAVAVTTARKAVTVMLSFALFRSDKPLTEKYLGATALFFGAIACEYYKAEARRRRAKAAMEKGVVGVDAEGGKGDELNTSEGGELPWGGRRSVDGRGVATRGMDRELAPVRLK
jgi:adenosine 3'-phospho 5'-phosphosulfate transporter B3